MMILGSIFIGTLLLGLLYQLPPVYGWLSWRFAHLRTEIRHALNPPEEAVFVPQEQDKLEMNEEMDGLLTTPSLVPILTNTPDPSPTLLKPSPTSAETATPIPAKTQLPDSVTLTGVVHEYQQMNNCGPATLSMALSFWGWQGDQRDTRAYLRPNFAEYDDKNVSPFEMMTYVETQTKFKAVVRVGGNLGLLKRFIAAGFPVIIEKGFQPPKEDWMGHYELITGYDDSRARFITQDSYIMADFPVPYSEITEHWWRDFNYIYVVVFPPDRQAVVNEILDSQVDPILNYQDSADRAEAETVSLTGRDQFFAWYNLGTNQLALGNVQSAARAYDQAFALYAQIPESERPWRMLWYQVGPYEAYYYTGRYQDVISLVNQTLSFLGSPILEESLYWRGRAREGLGDLEGAVEDLTKAAEINPTSTDVLSQLDRLGDYYP